MKKFLIHVLILSLLLSSIGLLGTQKVNAEQNKWGETLEMNSMTDRFVDFVTMNREGTLTFNGSVIDKDTVPGSLTISIKPLPEKAYVDLYKKLEAVPAIKEFSGITSSKGLNNEVVNLGKGEYVVLFELHNGTGNFSNTALKLNISFERQYNRPVNITNLNTNKVEVWGDFNDKYDKITFGEDLNELVLPFNTTESGGLSFKIKETEQFYKSLKATVYQDEKCTKPMGSPLVLKNGNKLASAVIDIPQKGTYYVKFIIEREENETLHVDFKVQLYLLNGNDRSLTDKTTYVVYENTKKDKITYKVIVPKTSSIGIQIQPASDNLQNSAKVKLLDSNKKDLSKQSYIATETSSNGEYEPLDQYYTVDKGTYYIQVDTNCTVYSLAYRCVAVRDQSGTEKSKAKTIEVGGNPIEGYCSVAENAAKVDWYKFYLPSKQYITYELSYNLDGIAKIEIINAKGKIVNDDSPLKSGAFTAYASSYWEKGTYYIKVYKVDKTSSMDYELMVYSE